MIEHDISEHTFVICPECGGSIHLSDNESVVRKEEDSVWLRCRNNCCGHVARYSTSEIMVRPEALTADYTTQIFLDE